LEETVTGKARLLCRLPLRQCGLTVREWTRTDVDRLASWPPYPFPYQGFEFSFAGMGPEKRDETFRARQDRADAFVLVVELTAQPAVGCVALRSIEWETGTIGNVGVRVHPDWCSRGVGTSIVRLVTRWSFECGIARWRLDVAASNARAVRCYEKVGFVRVGEFWRDASHLSKLDVDRPCYHFLRPHLRGRGRELELRFWRMELRAG
jgi:RimJ/RimL family protein N-acetyltransferase